MQFPQERENKMGIIRREIADCVHLCYLETDKFKTGFMSVNFIAPLDASTAAKNALIPSVLLRGSEKYPNMAEINKKLDYLYASGLSPRNDKRGEIQIFGITASMIDSAYTINGEDIVSEVTDILFEVLLHPVTDGEAFDNAYTESEKKNLIDGINAKINNKTYYARQRCIAEMCKDERFGLSETGTVEEVASCGADTLYAQYRYALAHYPIEIFFVGHCDVDALTNKLTALISELPRSSVAIPKTDIVRSAKEVKHINEEMPVNQGKLSIGFRTGTVIGEAEHPALMMFNEIFGGGVTSKLFMNVREKMSLCYYCSSAPDSTKGIMIVNSGIEVKNRDIAERAILEQLDAIREGNFTDGEQESAKLSIINSYRELSDSARGLESWYLVRGLLGVGGDPQSALESIRSVTRQQIIAAANKVTLDTVYFLNGTLKGESKDA